LAFSDFLEFSVHHNIPEIGKINRRGKIFRKKPNAGAIPRVSYLLQYEYFERGD